MSLVEYMFNMAALAGIILLWKIGMIYINFAGKFCLFVEFIQPSQGKAQVNWPLLQ